MLPLPTNSLLVHGVYPPPLRVRTPALRPFPAAILPQVVQPALSALALEGPVALSFAVTVTALIVGTALLLGGLASRQQASHSPEEPLFGVRRRLPRPPRSR